MKMPFPRLTAVSPAKVNLHLAVLEKRPDGFHNIESIFLAVNFGDTLHFEPCEGENTAEIAVEGVSINIPTEKNIIFKALSLFREKTGFTQGLKIRAEKRIPLGGGLGGGSSNAAAALLTLNKLAGFPLNREQLLEMAASLGSDVPFFIYETPAAMVTGRGEFIEPLEIPELSLVLVNPGFSSDTAAAYQLLDKKRELEYKTASGATVPPVRKDINLSRMADTFRNDFLPVFEEPEKSVYYGIISQLRELGAQYANLSGSGSTCFGIFKEREKAEKAAASLRGKWGFVECTSPR
jgi:4-diphosphocytidyl-2-C-methyl-D-erythritol kinase